MSNCDCEKISVLMGVYNCARTVGEAIESIQNQTYTNWELIICDDGSVDETYDIAKEYEKKDRRIIVIKNECNLGLNKTLNKCFINSSGDYIARMDGDDKSFPDRFEKEVKVLKTKRNIKLVSSPMVLFDENGVWGKTESIEYPKAENIIEGTAICHAPVMMYRECLEKANGYSIDKRTMRVEDVDLWLRLYGMGYRCYNIQEPLYSMRNDKNALNRRKYKYRLNETYVKINGCRELKLGFKYYLKSLKPLIVGLVPAEIRSYIRRKQYKSSL